MLSSIAEFLPLAAGIMISPMPIIAMIVLCVTGRAKDGGSAFLLGWLFSIVFLMSAAVLFLGNFSFQELGSAAIWSIIVQFIAALIIFFISWQNFKTPAPNPEKDGGSIPAWIVDFTEMPLYKLFFFGIIMEAGNLKNLPIMVAAGLAIAKDTSSWQRGMLDAAVFAIVASISLIIPWAATIFGNATTKDAIESSRDWLYRNNYVIMAVLLFYIAITVLSAGIANLGILLGG